MPFFEFSSNRSYRTVLLSMLGSVLLGLSTFNCTPTRNRPQRKIFRLALFSEPYSLDPRKNRDVSSSTIQNILFEGLTQLLENGEIEWAQAKNATISEDGLIYTFYLRKTEWSDGNPVTAKDFENAWKQSISPSFASASAFLLSPILNAPAILRGELPVDQLGVVAIDERTLRVQLSKPVPYFLSLVSMCPFFPIPTHIERANSRWAMDPNPRQFVSNGPFKLSIYKKNENYVFEKNPNYWDVSHIKLEKIYAYFIGDETTCLQMFEAKEIDYLNSFFTPLSLDNLGNYKKNNKLITYPTAGTIFCSFNLKHPYLQNQKLRKALSLGVDRSSIVSNISQMNESPAYRLIPPILSPDPTYKCVEPFNPELAQTLFNEGIDELGLTLEEIENEFVLSYENNQQNRRIAQTIQQYWEDLFGIKVTLKGAVDLIHLGNLEQRKYFIAIDYWLAHYIDPTCILNRFKYRQSKKNFPGYENERYISLLEQAEETSNSVLRNQLLEQAEEIIASDCPLAPIFHFNVITLQSEEFEEIKVNPIGTPIFKNIRPIESAHVY